MAPWIIIKLCVLFVRHRWLLRMRFSNCKLYSQSVTTPPQKTANWWDFYSQLAGAGRRGGRKLKKKKKKVWDFNVPGSAGVARRSCSSEICLCEQHIQRLLGWVLSEVREKTELSRPSKTQVQINPCAKSYRDVNRDAIYGSVSVRREGDDTNTLFNCVTSSASPPRYFVVGDQSERDMSQMRYKHLTWADDQSSAAPQSIFDVTASEILLASKRQIFRQTLPNDGFQQRCIGRRSEGSIRLCTKEFQGSPHSMKARGRPLPVCPFVAVISSDPGRRFQPWCQRLSNRAALTVKERDFEVGAAAFRHFWRKCAGLKALGTVDIWCYIGSLMTQTRIELESEAKSEVVIGHMLRSLIAYVLWMSAQGPIRSCPRRAPRNIPVFFFFVFFFRRGSQSFKLLMQNEIIKDNMSKVPVLKRSWNFYEHHPAFLKPDVGSQAFSVAHFSDSINKIWRSHGCA